jgi:hypothetical protein
MKVEDLLRNHEVGSSQLAFSMPIFNSLLVSFRKLVFFGG